MFFLGNETVKELGEPCIANVCNLLICIETSLSTYLETFSYNVSCPSIKKQLGFLLKTCLV